MIVNRRGYVARGKKGWDNPGRNWWLVKESDKTRNKEPLGAVVLNNVMFPAEFIGRRVRFKVEVIDDGDVDTGYEIRSRRGNFSTRIKDYIEVVHND